MPESKRTPKRTSRKTSDHSVQTNRGSATAEDPAGNGQSFLRQLTDDFRWQDRLPPPDNIDQLREELISDLIDVPVIALDGEVTNVYDKINYEGFISSEDRKLVWNCLAVVRKMYWNLEIEDDGAGYQWNMNWRHTRAEVDQVYEASRLLKLSARETRDALIASIFSDSIKSRGNFIIHNVHGSQAAVLVLSYLLDVSKATHRKSMERIARATREHQIAPPEFMATVVAIMLHHKHRLKRFSPDGPASSSAKAKQIFSIYNKVRKPFEPDNLNRDKTLIAFSDDERKLLETIGIKDWYVPHPDNKDSRLAHAVIAGDHSINYNNPEGFAKIALLRGPDTESIFEDPTIHHSLESAVHSFTDSFDVIRPEVQGMALTGLRRTQRAVERVIAIMNELFNGIKVGPKGKHEKQNGYDLIEQAIKRAHTKRPQLYTAEYCALSDEGDKQVEKALERVGEIMNEWFETFSDIPFSPKENHLDEPGPGRLPFWNAPLKYPERDEQGNLDHQSLSELQRLQFKFADRIREIVVELLRAEQWIFSIEQD